MTDEFITANRKEARIVLLEKLAGQAQEQYLQLAKRQDILEDDIGTIKQTVVETKTILEARDERCAAHAQEIKDSKGIAIDAHGKLGVVNRQMADIQCKTWPTVIKIITIYTAAMTLGASIVVALINMIEAGH